MECPSRKRECAQNFLNYYIINLSIVVSYFLFKFGAMELP